MDSYNGTLINDDTSCGAAVKEEPDLCFPFLPLLWRSNPIINMNVVLMKMYLRLSMHKMHTQDVLLVLVVHLRCVF